MKKDPPCVTCSRLTLFGIRRTCVEDPARDPLFYDADNSVIFASATQNTHNAQNTLISSFISIDLDTTAFSPR